MKKKKIADMDLEELCRASMDLENNYQAKIHSMQSGKGIGLIRGNYFRLKAKYEALIKEKRDIP